MGKFADIDKFHKTKKGKFVFGALELLAAYLFLSRAIDTGSLWQYLAFILLTIGGIHNLVRAVFHIGSKNTKGTLKNR